MSRYKRYEVIEGAVYVPQASAMENMASYTLLGIVCLGGGGWILAWLADAPGEVYRWVSIAAVSPVLILAGAALAIAGVHAVEEIKAALNPGTADDNRIEWKGDLWNL
jgi:hypothetical protein